MYITSLAIVLSTLIVASYSTTPPKDMTLQYPQTAQINERPNIYYGFGLPPNGIFRTVNILIEAPDGTVNKAIEKQPVLPRFSNGTIASCTTGPYSIYAANLALKRPLSQVGTHTLMWNVTFAISSDASQVTSWWCGPEPYSFQSWAFNTTVQVSDGPAPVNTSHIDTTTILQPEPTGNVILSGTRSAATPGWFNVGLATAFFVLVKISELL